MKTQTLLIWFVQLNLSKYSKGNIILTILCDRYGNVCTADISYNSQIILIIINFRNSDFW